MTELLLAALVWLGTHVGLSSTPLRAALVGRIGEKGFLIAYTLLALLAIFWLVRAYSDAPQIPLWPLGSLLNALALPLMLLAFVLLIAGVTVKNPTSLAAGGGGPGEPHGVLRVTRHPVMWALGIWAVAHVLANGDLASLVFFGSMALLALGGTRLIDAKSAARRGEAWQGFAKTTSNLPFGAILTGHQRLALGEIGWWRIGLGVLLFAAFLHLHLWLFGVSPIAAF